MTDQRSTGGLVAHESAGQPPTDPMVLAAFGDASKDVAFMWRWVLLAGAAGGWAGLLVGGVLGRIAMFVLRRTSGEFVNGVKSDDGFTIGRVSTSSLFLLFLTMVLGMIVGLVVVLARSQLRGWLGATLLVLAAGTLGAADIIKPEGVDFNLLSPLPLACAMFTAIPLGVIALTLVFAHRWRAWWWKSRGRTVAAMAPWVLTLPAFFFTVPAALAAFGLGVVALRIQVVRHLLTNRVGQYLAAAITIAILVLASSELYSDIVEIVN